MSLMLVDVLRFLASLMVQWVLAVCRFAGIAFDVIWLVSDSLDCVVSPCVSWVARVNGGVASGLGGALVLFGGCGSNIVPCMAHFARRAEGVLGVRGLELRWG
jgi:hypothetical protein